MTPDLLDEIQFTMELWQKQHSNTLCTAGCLKDRFNVGEVGLVVEEPPTAAPNFTRWTTESFTFSSQLGFSFKSSFTNNLGHSLEPASLLVSIQVREIEWLRCAIGIVSGFHGNLCLLWLAIGMAHNGTIVVLDRDGDSPGAYRIFWHVSGRECIVSSFGVCRCVVKYQNMVVIGVVFLKDFDRFFTVLDNALVGIVSITSFTSLEPQWKMD